jgi:hypothetical protein
MGVGWSIASGIMSFGSLSPSLSLSLLDGLDLSTGTNGKCEDTHNINIRRPLGLRQVTFHLLLSPPSTRKHITLREIPSLQSRIRAFAQ